MTRRAWLLVLALHLAPCAARAAPGCSLSLASITFGSYDVFAGGDLTWSGTASYTCTGGANGPIYIELGTGLYGTYAERQAANGASRLDYNLYTSASSATVWGDGNGGTGEYYSAANPANGQPYLVPVYGRIRARQDAAVGTYTDTIAATIYWTRKQVTNRAVINVPVSVPVVSRCTIATTPVDFGPYDPVTANATAPRNATGTVTTTCTRGAVTTIGLDAGRSPTGTQRRMTDGAGSFLAYGLFQDGAYALPWGTTGTGLLSPPAPPTFDPRTFTIYGQIPGGQDPSVGSYADTVTATITY